MRGRGGPAAGGSVPGVTEDIVRAVERMRGRIVPASTEQVVELIRGAGFDQRGQAIRFLAAPQGTSAYYTFQKEARKVADRIGREVHIVGTDGAIVAYDDALGGFVARRDGAAVEWRLIRPHGSRAGHAAPPPPGPPPAVFQPGMISRELAGLGVGDALTAGQARAALGGRAGGELAGVLTVLPPEEQARARWWLGRARAAAGWADEALGYLSGDPAFGRSQAELRELVRALVTGQPGLVEVGVALLVLRAVGDDVLEGIFSGEGRGMADVLEGAIPAGHVLRGELERLLAGRFAGGRAALGQGTVIARGHPAGEFRPGMISGGLAGLAVGDALTARQARAALRGRPDAELAGVLAVLPPAEQARGWWWLGRARAVAGWADQALDYLSGNPAAGLAPVELRELAGTLLTGLASAQERWLGLQLLETASDDELAVIFGDPRRMLQALEGSIPADHELVGPLERFFGARFEGGRAALADGRVIPRGQPAGEFSPALLDASLADLDIGAEPAGDAVARIMAAIARRSGTPGQSGTFIRGVSAALMELPPVQRARAARWLTGVRVAVRARAAEPPYVLEVLDDVLHGLYRAAALVPGGGQLSQVTLRPPRELAGRLREVLDPPPPRRPAGRGAGAAVVIRQLPGETEDFEAKFRRTLIAAIERLDQEGVAARGAVERAVPGSLYSMEHIGRIAAEARRQTHAVFPFVTGPALAPDRLGWGGNVHDMWTDWGSRFEAMTLEERRATARGYLLRYPHDTRLRHLLWEHQAAPRFDSAGQPLNPEAEIIGPVVDDLLKDEAILDQELAIWRGSPGLAGGGNIWIQVLRQPESQQNQVKLWAIFQIVVHEYLHLLQHPRYRAYAASLGMHSRAYNTLIEGADDWLTRTVVRNGELDVAAVRRIIEGRYRGWLPLHQLWLKKNYPSMAEAVRLIHVVGGVQNLYAAFFFGDVEKIAGPISLAVMGSPVRRSRPGRSPRWWPGSARCPTPSAGGCGSACSPTRRRGRSSGCWPSAAPTSWPSSPPRVVRRPGPAAPRRRGAGAGGPAHGGTESAVPPEAGRDLDLGPDDGPVILPPGSWEDEHGSVMIARAVGLFNVGLSAGRDGRWLVYDGDGQGFAARRLERGHLERLGWQRGDAIIAITRRRAGDRLEEGMEELGEAVGADVWYPAAGADLRLTPERQLQTVPVGGGEPADLWEVHVSRSLREQSGVEVPRWFAVGSDGVLGLAREAYWFRFRQGLASVGLLGFPGRLDLLEREPEPELYDLLLQRNERGELGLADPVDGFVPLSAGDMPGLPAGMVEVRLVMDDGEGVRAAAAALAERLGVPVWVTPRGAVVRVSQDGRLVAWQEDGPASWVQVLPGDRPAANAGFLPWYETGEGRVRSRRGEAVIELSHGDGGGVNGILLASHREYNAFLAGPVPRVPAGLYAVGADFVPGQGSPMFSLPDFDGSAELRPLGELQGLLRWHGWTDGRPVLILADFSGYAGEGADRDWEVLAGGLGGLAEAAGASVFFPGRGSRVEYRDRDPVVVGGEDPRWWRVDPPGGPGRPASPTLVQGPTGGLWLEPDARFVSLPLGDVSPAEGAALRSGAVSPADEMMHDRAPGYRGVRGDDGRGVFVVDVPLTGGGEIALAGDALGARPGGPSVAGAARAVELLRTEVVPASADLVVWMIRRAGYRPGRQVIQFLAAPPDWAAYRAFREQAQEVARLVGGDVYIVGPAGATVAYDAGREGFAAVLADGRPGRWERLSPRASGRQAGQEERGEQAGQEQPPDYFGTNEHGILAPRTPPPASALTALASGASDEASSEASDEAPDEDAIPAQRRSANVWLQTVPAATGRLRPESSTRGLDHDPWEIDWPLGSWEAEHGREMIASAQGGDGVRGGFVVVGVGADPEWSWLVYDGAGSGFPTGGMERRHLEALGWRPGQAIVVVTRRREGDGLEALLAELGEAVGADVWYPGARADLRLTGESRLQAVPAADGGPEDLWRVHVSRSLRETSGIEVPAWLEASDEGVLVPAVPARGFFWFEFHGGWTSMRPAQFPARMSSLRWRPVPGLFDLVLQRNERGELGLARP